MLPYCACPEVAVVLDVSKDDACLHFCCLIRAMPRECNVPKSLIARPLLCRLLRVVASKAVVESNRFGGLLEASKREQNGPSTRGNRAQVPLGAKSPHCKTLFTLPTIHFHSHSLPLYHLIYSTFGVLISSGDVLGLFGIAVINIFGFLFLCSMIPHHHSPARAFTDATSLLMLHLC